MTTCIDIIFLIIFYPAKHMTTPARPKIKYKIRKRSWRWKLRPLLAMSLVCMSTTTRYHTGIPTGVDSESIGIDNRATACISHQASDFVGTLRDTNRVIVGYNGSRTTNIKVGTIRWKWTDDQGVSHIHTIPNSFYSPDGGIRLLSPQHWAQSICKNEKS